MKGHTISGNEIEINASKDYDDCGTCKRWYWSEVYITMNGHEMDIDDLSDRNKEYIIDQLPTL
jgi:putative IMPACT (imprinted ancient) family translation regulator